MGGPTFTLLTHSNFNIPENFPFYPSILTEASNFSSAIVPCTGVLQTSPPFFGLAVCERFLAFLDRELNYDFIASPLICGKVQRAHLWPKASVQHH